MKKLLIGAGVVAVLTSGAYLPADAAEQAINLNATVDAYCSIAGSASPGDLTPSWPNIPEGKVPVGAPNQTVSIGNVVCNSKAHVTLTSQNGALITSASAEPGFQNYINYSASVSSPASVSIAADSTSGTVSSRSATNDSAGATNGPVDVVFTPVASGDLVAGSYSDVLTVSIVAF